MYSEKIEPILEDLENKELEIAGGSVVGIVLATVNSLVKYIANLTLGKKSYEDVQDKIRRILEKAEYLKEMSLEAIDKDKEILEEILDVYKIKKENEEQYQKVCRKATDFCMKVVEIAEDTLKISNEVSKVGNKMLESDFKICKYYAIASVKSAIVNVEINAKYIRDDKYKTEIETRCMEILNKIENISC